MVGALSSDYVIRSWQRRIEQRALVQMELSRAMEQIIRDVRATVGTGITEYPNGQSCPRTAAIHFRKDIANNSLYIHLRQDPDVTTIGDEYYVVYSYAYYDTVIPALIPVIGRWEWRGQTINDPLLNINYSILNIADHPEFFHINMNGTKLESIEITLTSRPDPWRAADPRDNPEYTLTTTLMPPGFSQ